MEPIKVIFVNGSSLNRGGIDAFMMNYFNNVDRSQIQIDFIVHGFSAGAYDNEILNQGGKIYKVPYLKDSPINYIKHIFDAFKKAQPDIIHSHMNAMNAIILMIAYFHNVPIRISHSHSVNILSNSIIKRLYHNIIKRFIPLFATELWACSASASKWLYGNKVTPKVIHNAILIEDYLYNDKIREHYRNLLGMQDELVLGHVGSLREEKNFDFTLEVFSKMLNDKSDCKLLLIGDGPKKIQLIQRAKKLNIAEKVIFLGVRNDVNKLLQAIDIVLMPSYHEGLPFTLIEAQFSSLHIYVSENITDECVFTNKVNKLKLEIGANKWAKAILRTKIVNRQDNTMCDKYNIKVQAKILENKYIRIINNYH